jgi:DNA-binding CsgD family transcriptional regulator
VSVPAIFFVDEKKLPTIQFELVLLTRREKEVLHLLAKGYGSTQIKEDRHR